MRKRYAIRALGLLIALTGVNIGCHQEPAVPKSAIPLTCQIYQIAAVEENVHDTTTFTYDAFGSLTESHFRRWWLDTLNTRLRQTYSYNADHYLTIRVDQQDRLGRSTERRSYDYSYQDGLIRQVVVKDYQSGQITGYLDYEYDNGKLKTYKESNSQKTVLRQYTFDTSGKLTDYQDPDQLTSAQVTNGKIVSKLFKNGARVASTFDSQGQLISETTLAGTAETKTTYTYDNEPYWDKTQLRLRGIPIVDMGGHMNVHNLTSVAVQQTVGGRVTQARTLTYRNAYNQARYLFGYARSDGAQQRTIYANCL
ncbi:hypothetical protein [Spirosoma rhododendri]|uniref:YD repeat-containing protein n=1 Tax=Spirosoma rhododendri TaxID=2728024 RepID=A0A7L5DTJ3_9BACT|nr:hypothetical protein [Spirosoma rhododendri]QJD78880.1 hypothetical protein HH216_10890 [Spirosoma rhododendri]